ncbi:MAG TPA: hypothetical protein VK608_12865 [Edaphobacter sp.]|nr:hypothetical protein [Edaphobacter sp.]
MRKGGLEKGQLFLENRDLWLGLPASPNVAQQVLLPPTVNAYIAVIADSPAHPPTMDS